MIIYHFKRIPEKQGIIACSDNFVNFIVDLHSEHRAKHNCPPLKLDKYLTVYAMDSAKASHLTNTNTLVHRNSQEDGENVLKATGWDITAEEIMKTWYGEECQYKYTDTKFPTVCGHFTQIVWRVDSSAVTKSTSLLNGGGTRRPRLAQ
uniref:SCP domain-containing protein n=1 Tax=Glossina morsitans morsitans TaxID=37546 RepID=A0A1B0FKM5_GLOMM